MGNCCNNRIEFLEVLDYKQHAELNVLERDRSGSCIGRSIVSFALLGPSDQAYNLISLPKLTVRASGCILQGLDPRGECEKECQDSFAFIYKEKNLLSVLFDGHGKDGRRVSLFCRDFMLKYFDKNFETFETDPLNTIEDMVESCDAELSTSGIECTLSGTTALIVMINNTGIHAGSVGDSRAVLATLPKDSNSIGFPVYKAFPYKRPVQPIRNLHAVALTIDQKPNHEEELRRIRNAGGVVEKLADDMGRPVGPYRVWKKKGNLPGLAMSRSIGDKVAHEIGVISKPICHTFKLYSGFDQFIVLASDGVWDVMENYEVVNLVEKFRNSSQTSGNSYPARTSNSTIARLLCEEARYRWFGVIEEEDVMIDDISCIILELNCIEPSKSNEIAQVDERKIDKFKSMAIDPSGIIETSNPVRKDPTRGSMAAEVNPIIDALLEVQNDDKTQ
jgi:serine/threonine protein phosphatase PrpC